MTFVLEARSVNKSFGAVVAARDLNVFVAPREIVGIIGANGAGKTTFVNLVSGYLAPDSGRIFHKGREITGLKPRAIARLGLCRSFQIAQIFPKLSVLDNLIAALNIGKGRDRQFLSSARTPQLIEAAQRTLGEYGLDAAAKQLAETLPQGLRKLLDITMATINEPELVLLDEPTSGISVDEKFGMMDTVTKPMKTRGATILFIEHDMEIVERYAQRVIAFYEGRIIADGSPASVLSDSEVRTYVVGTELYRRPQASERT